MSKVLEQSIYDYVIEDRTIMYIINIYEYDKGHCMLDCSWG